MIRLSYVEHEHDDKGGKVTRHDPRRGLSDYTVYTIHTAKAMTTHEMREAGDYVIYLLQKADYGQDEAFARVAKHPIACYVYNSVTIKLILFSRFDGGNVMRALVSGSKNL